MSLPPKTLKDYYRDLNYIMGITSHGPSKTFCFRRLNLLESKYQLHVHLNAEHELSCQKVSSLCVSPYIICNTNYYKKRVPHRDFYNVRKVDNHVHHSSSMNQKHLLRFIKHKLKECPGVCFIACGQFALGAGMLYTILSNHF